MTLPAARRRRIVATLALVAACCLPAYAQAQHRNAYTPAAGGAVRTVTAEYGMVVAQEKFAARIGADVLRRGGNAVDAAVATGFALAVTYPRAGNIGGGGFMVIQLAKGNQYTAIDYREIAPAATTRDIFLGPDCKPDQTKSLNSALGIGVPGTVAGLALALDQYGSGKFTLAELLKPAIYLATDGIPVADATADTLAEGRARPSASVSAVSSATGMPSVASSIAGFKSSASVNLPEPY